MTPELLGANSVLPLIVARSCEQAGVLRLVHLSSAAVQGRHRLDETRATYAFSPYSHSKALAEAWLRESAVEVICLRPTSVHGPEREVTRRIVSLASSQFSSVAGSGRHPTPQTQVATVASAAVFVAGYRGRPPSSVLLTPDEGLTTGEFLEAIGGRAPHHLPEAVTRLVVRLGYAIGMRSVFVRAMARRLEMLWHGQSRTAGWLDTFSGLTAPRDDWTSLGGDRSIGGRPKVLFGVTSGVSVQGFFSGQHRFLKEEGWEVSLACSEEGAPQEFSKGEGSTYVPVAASRRPNPLADIRTLFRLTLLLRRTRPDVAVWGTPKVGLLGSVASRVTRTPAIYVVHGLRLESSSGLMRKVLVLSERIACRCASRVVAVGHELRQRMVELRLTERQRILVLGNGSANGVRVPVSASVETARDSTSVLVGFVGRITADKGLWELATAWQAVRNAHPEVRMLIVGAAEADDDSQRLRQHLETLDGVSIIGPVDDIDAIYRQLDLLVLPSHREGLPNVIIEAAAHSVPSITSDATGASEPVVDGVTGLIVPVKRAEVLAEVMSALIGDSQTRLEMGSRAKELVFERYAQVALWKQWNRLLQSVATKATSIPGLEEIERRA